ncbi:tyrosine--tRNA ligase [Saprospiraceae bacterium]|nr:tyrosine--tRNA ligase [Saprospiraceae bacterium]
MNFIEELRWRGMLHDMTPGIEEKMNEGSVVGYIGFDPTAPSLTIGNYVQVMLLHFFQESGHKPIVLMGGATGRVGDPSGKDKERQLKSHDELDSNLLFQLEQFKDLLDFEGENAAIVENNYDFYKEMNVLDFLRDVGKNLTVNYMLSKDSVKKRLETGISYTEFSYQLLQAYDYLCLLRKHRCIVQMGGSDQWGNITSGTEFIRRNTYDKAFAVTTPLLTKADGSKFGKSEAGNIWLDPKLTSPYKFFQFWINASDADLPKFMRYFTYKTKEEVEALEAEHAENPNALKRILAEELTVRIHSRKDYENVSKVSNLLFNKKASREELLSMNTESLEAVSEEIPNFTTNVSIPFSTEELLCEHTTIFSSKSEYRRAVKGNAISVNKTKISDPNFEITAEEILQGRFIIIENGKKNKFIIELKA